MHCFSVFMNPSADSAASPQPSSAQGVYGAFFKNKAERKAFEKQVEALRHAVLGGSEREWAAAFGPLRGHPLLPDILSNVSFGGAPLLALAADIGFAAAVQSLINAGAHPDAPGPRGMTALMLACDHGNLECARFLAPVSTLSAKKERPGADHAASALHFAAAEGRADIIPVVATEDGGRLRMTRGMTPLMAAAAPFEVASKCNWSGHVETARALLPFSDAFARMDESDPARGGHTALMVALDEDRSWGPLHETLLAGMIEQEKKATRPGDADRGGWRERHLVDICLFRGEEQELAAKALMDAGADPLARALSTSRLPAEHQAFWIALHTHLVSTAALMAQALEKQNRYPREERQAFFLEAVNHAIAGGAFDMVDVLAPFCDLTGAQLRDGVETRKRWSHSDGFLTQWTARWEALQLLAATQGHENADALISRAPRSAALAAHSAATRSDVAPGDAKTPSRRL